MPKEADMKDQILAFAKANPLRAAVLAVIILAALGGLLEGLF
jgi:hypothetical protein